MVSSLRAEGFKTKIHCKPASTGMYNDSCGVQDSDKNNALYCE
jgi:hypothetical protein